MGMKQTYSIQPPSYKAYRHSRRNHWHHNDQICSLHITEERGRWIARFEFNEDDTGEYVAPSLTAAKNFLTRERRKRITRLLNPVKS